MCHEPGSRPPGPPSVGEVARTAPLHLTAGDGNELAAFEAEPAGTGPHPGLVLLPDVRGLHPYYVALATRFAEAGVHTVAIDYFGRSAGASTRAEDFDWQSHVPLVTPEHVAADAGAAAAHLRSAGVLDVFTLGFCFGGGQSWALSAGALDLAGCMGFYGRPALLEQVAGALRSPLLMLIAGADQATPVEEVSALAQRLRDAGNDVESHVYPGAPHSFFDRTFADHADACADAWERMLAFVGRLQTAA